MTCIAGLVDNRTVFIGADSASTNDVDQQTIRADTKIFRNGDFLFGCTSSYRMTQLLRYSLVLPGLQDLEKEGDEDPLFRYMATDFVNTVRICLREGGFAKKEDECESGGSFLVAWRGRLFSIGDDYQVEEAICGYNAVGSGDDLALGVLHVTSHLDLSPEQRIQYALEAAAYHNSSVRPPFIIRCLSPQTEPEEALS